MNTRPENVFWVPPAARWQHLRDHARHPGIGALVDGAMEAIEAENESLRGVLPKNYNRESLNKFVLGDLIDLFSRIGMDAATDSSLDVLGRVYEYFLGSFAGAEGKRGGEFYTPGSVVRLLVDMLEPYKGRIYDPCCGSGGMFVQSERFVEEHGGRIGDIAIYGQESNHTTWRLARMNLAVRGIDADIRWNNEGSFHRDELPDLKADFILANPPFNVSDWSGDRLREDARWKFGLPPRGNANYAWLQHIHHHLAPGGTAGVVLANGSMSSAQSGEGGIRQALLEGDVVDCMVALPGQLFYSTQIPACLWFLARNKDPKGWRNRQGEVLFIDARGLGQMVDRTRREFSDEDIAQVAATYQAWRGEPEARSYADVPGFCKAATLQEIRAQGYVLTPGRYVGQTAPEMDDEPFADKMTRLAADLRAQQAEGRRLDAVIPLTSILWVTKIGSGGRMLNEKPRIEAFESAIERLEEGLTRYRTDTSDAQIRDGLIQRFEFTYEASHKILKRYLEYTSPNPEQHARASFQDLIRSGNEMGLLLGEWEDWRSFRVMRGKTSHVYDEKITLEVVQDIPRFLKEVVYLRDRLREKLT